MVRGRSGVVRFVCCKSRSYVGLLSRDVAGRSAGRLFGHISLVREILEHGSVIDQQHKRRQSITNREAATLLQDISALGLKNTLKSLSATFFCSMFWL